MKTVFLDIETNGLMDRGDRILCMSLRSLGGSVQTYSNPEEYPKVLKGLQRVDLIVGHNLIGFDLPFIRKLYPWFRVEGCVRDTLVMARMLFPDIGESDWALVRKNRLPGNLVNSHSLKAWGYRLGTLKGRVMEEMTRNPDTLYTAQATPHLIEYCELDTEITEILWRHCEDQGPSEDATITEHQFAEIIYEQEERGVGFDVAAAERLVCKLQIQRDELLRQLERLFEPTVVELKTKTKEIPFNPGSRPQIADRLMKRGWRPKKLTATQQPCVDEDVLESLCPKFPECKKLLEYLTIDKRLGQLAEGREAWLRHVDAKGRIHGRVNTIGAVTARCTHSRPNLAQVPKASDKVPFGKECRSLFVPAPGMVMIGADASGLELRCLAHYLGRYDGGQYAKAVLEVEDIHTYHQELAGIETRDATKNGFYAYVYGAGDLKLGVTIGKKTAAAGREFRQKFLKAIPALAQLQRDIRARAAEGCLLAIDGRRLPIRSEHAALNTLLQSAGAIAVKLATVYMDRKLVQIFKDKAPRQVLHIHDEVQFEARPEIAEEAGKVICECFTQAGEALEFRCPLAGEFKIGKNWAETH